MTAFAAERYRSGAAAIAGGSGGLGRAIARGLGRGRRPDRGHLEPEPRAGGRTGRGTGRGRPCRRPSSRLAQAGRRGGLS